MTPSSADDEAWDRIERLVTSMQELQAKKVFDLARRLLPKDFQLRDDGEKLLGPGNGLVAAPLVNENDLEGSFSIGEVLPPSSNQGGNMTLGIVSQQNKAQWLSRHGEQVRQL